MIDQYYYLRWGDPNKLAIDCYYDGSADFLAMGSEMLKSLRLAWGERDRATRLTRIEAVRLAEFMRTSGLRGVRIVRVTVRSSGTL